MNWSDGEYKLNKNIKSINNDPGPKYTQPNHSGVGLALCYYVHLLFRV
jgi:hypothetical protein